MRKDHSLDRLSDYSNESLLRELMRVAKLVGKESLTLQDIEDHARCSYAILKQRFGGLHQALVHAGLSSRPFHRNVSDDELLNELERIWDLALASEGRRPFRGDLKKYGSRFSHGPYLRRWGSWIRACEVLLDRSVQSASLPSAPGQPAQGPLTSSRQNRLKRPIPLKLRYDVLRRDGFRCVLCGRSPATLYGLKLHVDHITPESSGGLAVIENLRTLCDECNLGRGSARDEVAQPTLAADAPQVARR